MWFEILSQIEQVKENLMKKYVICLDNRSNPESLIVGKVYRILTDDQASKVGLIRVLDETYGETGSQEGYLYPQKLFAEIKLPKEAERAFEQVNF